VLAPLGDDTGDWALGFPVDRRVGRDDVLAPVFETAGVLSTVRVCGVVLVGRGVALGLGFVPVTPVEDVVGAVELVVSPAPAAT